MPLIGVSIFAAIREVSHSVHVEAIATREIRRSFRERNAVSE